MRTGNCSLGGNLVPIQVVHKSLDVAHICFLDAILSKSGWTGMSSLSYLLQKEADFATVTISMAMVYDLESARQAF